MKILAFDASTQQCSVALYAHGEIRARSETAPNQHAKSILNFIHALLCEAGLSVNQLDVVGFGRGPGSFTGLRIAASIAQGLCAPHAIPVAPISTLLILATKAQHTFKTEKVAVAMDARMNQIYWGTFIQCASGHMVLEGKERVIAPLEASLNTKGWVGVGSGFGAYASTLEALQPYLTETDETATPEARTLIELTKQHAQAKLTVSAEHALPVYLRDKVC